MSKNQSIGLGVVALAVLFGSVWIVQSRSVAPGGANSAPAAQAATEAPRSAPSAGPSVVPPPTVVADDGPPAGDVPPVADAADVPSVANPSVANPVAENPVAENPPPGISLMPRIGTSVPSPSMAPPFLPGDAPPMPAAVGFGGPGIGIGGRGVFITPK